MMAVKLSGNKPSVTSTLALKKGQLGIVTEGPYVGLIVQKVNSDLFAVGSRELWPDGASCVDLPIRILENGELLEVVDNK